MTVQAPSREAELEALRAQLQRVQAELAAERSRAELKDEFLALVAHALRAPLGAILGWAHMLRRRGGQEEMTKGLDVIEQSVHAQTRLIEDLLTMGRMASDKIRIDLTPLDMRAVIEAAVESARPAAADKGVKLRKIVDLPLPAVRGDAARLQQVLGHMLANAVKFTPEGGTVRVSLKSSRGWAVMAVMDNGAGIAPELLPHLFDQFGRRSSSARSHGGLGLGLAIARHLVELHGGEITAESEGEGRGATFAIRLPLAEAH